MTTTLLSDDDLQAQRLKLQKFCIWTLIIASLFTPVQVAVGIMMDIPALSLYSLLQIPAMILIGLSWYLLRSQTTPLRTIVFLLGTALLVTAIGGAAVIKTYAPIMVLLPPIAVTIGMVYLDARDLRRLVWFAFACSFALFAVIRFVSIVPEPPTWITDGLVLLGGPVITRLLFFMYSNYHQRLSTMVEGLQQARNTLEMQVEERTAQLSASLEETRTSREQALAKQREAEELLVELRAAQAETERQAQEAQRLQQASQREKEELQHAVTEYLAFTQAIAGGDLAQRVKGSYQGALGQLRDGLNHMAESLQGITGQVQEAVSNISSAASEILAATTQQAAGAAQQSASITQTTTTIEEIKAIAQQTAQQAAQVASDSQKALSIARQGTSSVEETLGGMDQIKVRVEGIAETILSLAEQTQAISAIIQTVGELADQSNLLALNAAIEAARAGEQGKSFAVVAQHVRDLAERSKGATGQIREILGEIQQATNTAVMVTEEGTKGVTVGAQLASKTGHVIHRIAEEVESGAQANVQMAAAAQQQTAGIEQIGQAMLSIQQATTQTLSSTRQAERAARDLTTLAQRLTETLRVYRLR